MSGRVLGVDCGERWIGLALSDEIRILATPVTILDRAGGLAPVFDAMIDLVQREGVVKIIVGLPLNADGSEGRQARRTRDFARAAERVIGVPVELWDERLSSVEAEQLVRTQWRDLKAMKRRRGRIDAVAAAVILQDYLDRAAS